MGLWLFFLGLGFQCDYKFQSHSGLKFPFQYSIFFKKKFWWFNLNLVMPFYWCGVGRLTEIATWIWFPTKNNTGFFLILLWLTWIGLFGIYIIHNLRLLLIDFLVIESEWSDTVNVQPKFDVSLIFCYFGLICEHRVIYASL